MATMSMTEEKEDRGKMLVVFREVAEGLSKLEADDRHKIFDSILDWYLGGTGEVEGLTPTAALVVQMICNKQMAYKKVSDNRREAGTRSGASRRARTNVRTKSNSISTSTSTSDSSSASSSISSSTANTDIMCAPPTIEEVREYCRERNNRVDAQNWYDFYTSNGWKVGKNPMKDWRASIRTWEKNGIGMTASGRRANGMLTDPYRRKASNWRGTNPEDIEDVL